MKKIPEKLRGYPQYEAIKRTLDISVYDSLTEAEFEESWRKMIYISMNSWTMNGWGVCMRSGVGLFLCLLKTYFAQVCLQLRGVRACIHFSTNMFTPGQP